MNEAEPSKARAPGPSDEELMRGLRAGDPGVLRALLSRFLLPLERYAAGILNGGGDPAEAVQEAFIRLWEKREAWTHDRSLRSLLYTLTRNAAVDEIRRRHREVPLAEGSAATLPSPEPDPLHRAQEEELKALAEEAVSRLPPRRQEIFRLVREGGLSYQEVGQVLGISAQTVANLMSLALSNLRAELKPLLESPKTGAPGEPEHTRKIMGSD